MHTSWTLLPSVEVLLLCELFSGRIGGEAQGTLSIGTEREGRAVCVPAPPPWTGACGSREGQTPGLHATAVSTGTLRTHPVHFNHKARPSFCEAEVGVHQP